ncbi:serine hydrolase domain-containing protein [Massilia aurea]|uniref:serine hydrolase domain-containing protein n=1 Tax=Massilia aurea TaxID=373040 RepID=UPI00346358C9
MKKMLTLLACLLIAAPLQAAAPISPSLEPDIARLLREEGLQGAVWTTLEREGAAGVRDARTGMPMRVDQRVHVGSIAKTVLAVGILRLVSEHRLLLETPVATLLPQIRLDNRWNTTDPVRIRHLLDHTAGLDDVHLWHVFSLQADAHTPLAAAFPPGSRTLRVRQRPGARVSYSNLGYTLLGMVVEAVTGQPYEIYLDAALLAPLGMHDSTFAFVSQANDSRLAMGHFEDGVTQPAVASFVRPGGQFTTTAADMGRLARFLMSDGRLAGQPFIDTALLQQMGAPAGTEAARAGLSVGYALGLRTVDRHGVVAKCHGGSTAGFRAMLCLWPGTQQAFFIALNADSETADYARFDALLVRALMPALPVSPSGPAQQAASWDGWYVPAPNRFDSFRFLDTVFNPVHVSRDGQALKLTSPQAAPVTLQPVGGALFRAPDKQRASHAFIVSTEGTRIYSTGTQSYEQMPFPTLLALWISVAAGLLGLAWIVIASLLRRGPLVPCAGALALLLPLPFFISQSFLQLGELTIASGLLAVVTAALPVTMLAGLGLALHRRTVRRMEMGAMLAVLQLCLVLAWWGLLPLRLWA